jgi:hypothetical protein
MASVSVNFPLLMYSAMRARGATCIFPTVAIVLTVFADERGQLWMPSRALRAGGFHNSTAPASKTGQLISKHGKDRTTRQCCYRRSDLSNLSAVEHFGRSAK